MSMSTQDAAGRWRRPGAAAVVAVAGVPVCTGYAAVTYETYHGNFGYMAGYFVLVLMFVCSAVAGLVGAALVRGSGGTGPLLAGLLVGAGVRGGVPTSRSVSRSM